jgi:hypothetical protein
MLKFYLFHKLIHDFDKFRSVLIIFKGLMNIHEAYIETCGPGSSVGIATGYGMHGPGIEFRWGRDFPHLSKQALGTTQSPVHKVPGLSRE